MKDMGRLFSLSVKESKYFNDKQDKIELVGCPREGKECAQHLSVINKNFLTSGRYMREKDYPRSIEELKSAFYETNDIQEAYCIKCVDLIRSTITQSLEYIHDDLHKMTTGLFLRKRYQQSYLLATNVLAEIKKH